jgi:hypothetical protein
MPLIEKNISLAAVIVDEDLVPAGNRINAVSITDLSAGATFRLKLGNNNPFTVRDLGKLEIGSTAIDSDAGRGLKLLNPVAQAGAVATLLISYTSKSENAGAAPAITFMPA